MKDEEITIKEDSGGVLTSVALWKIDPQRERGLPYWKIELCYEKIDNSILELPVKTSCRWRKEFRVDTFMDVLHKLNELVKEGLE